MDIIVIANQKGGCAKTTTTVNLAAGLAALKQKVLVIDLDPQANTSSWLSANDSSVPGIWQFLIEQFPVSSVVRETSVKGVSLMPGSRLMSGFEKAMVGELAVETKLKRGLIHIADLGFDVVLIDTPPTLGLITLNALTASNWLLIPVTTHVMSLSGVAQLFKTLDEVKALLNAELKLLGLVASRVDTRTRHAKEILEALKERFGSQLCKAVVRENVRLAEAPSFKESIFDYSASSTAAKDYRDLSVEIFKRLQ
jgi:chromosome partitioning protein